MGVSSGASPWNKPIAILIFVCNRAAALKAQLTQLLRFRPSKERFPIVISQDCDSEEVANVVRSFEGSVEYLKVRCFCYTRHFFYQTIALLAYEQSKSKNRGAANSSPIQIVLFHRAPLSTWLSVYFR